MEWKPDEIKGLRKKLRMSQRQFAKRLGVKRQTVACWESSLRTPSKKMIAELEKLSTKIVDSKVVDKSVDTGVVDSKVVDMVKIVDNFVNKSVDREIVDRKNIDSKSVDRGNVDREIVDSEDVASEIVASGNVANEIVASESVARGSVAGESVAGENVASENVAGENVAGENVASEDVASEDVAAEAQQRAGTASENVTGKNETVTSDSDRVTGKSKSKFDPNYVTSVLELLHGDSDGIIEVRIFPNERYLKINGYREYVGKTVSGYYTDLTKIAQDVKAFDGKGNIYFTLNPVNPDLLARAANRLKYSVETTTKDNDIISDRWLPIDIDPVRPKDISSTDEELKLALKKQAEIVTWLDKFSIPTITGMSGNGAHILIPLAEGLRSDGTARGESGCTTAFIGYPNSQETRQAKEQFIHFLSYKFSDDKVSVDLTVFNMARIWKLYGTMAVKGDNISERPHRRAWLSIPEQMPEPIDLYAMLPDILPKKEKEENEPTPNQKSEQPGKFEWGRRRRQTHRTHATPADKSQPLDDQTGGSFTADDHELIEKAKNAKNGAKFTALWSGDTSGYDSQSEADLALCCLLAFWTGGDYERIDRLFRQSGLYREKWERDDYREQTIHKALENTTEFVGEVSATSLTNSVVEGVVCGKASWNASHPQTHRTLGQRTERKDEIKAQIAKIRRRKKAKAFEIKQAVSELIINDMKERGRFYQTNEEVCYYFDEEQKRLSRIGDDRRFGAQIEDVYGINPSEQEYQFLIFSLKTETLRRGDLTIIHQFAFYDTDANILYIDNNDNGIYKLDGKEVQLVDNGADKVLFLSDELCEPFEYMDIGGQKFLRPLVITPINFSSGDGVNLDKDEQGWLFAIDIHTKFFESLLPTKPIVAFIGPKGSGKTMAQRLILKVLFGSGFDVTSITKEDDFDAAVTANYIVAFDNVDGRIDWLNDKLAHTATGKMIQKRKLYTTNQNIRFFPKCFLMLNARTPRFKREDVTDRLLLFRTEPIDQKRSEAEIITEVLKVRNEIWSELLNDLNTIVSAFASEPANFTTAFRMADWAKCAWQIVKTLRKASCGTGRFVPSDNHEGVVEPDASHPASHAGYGEAFLDLLSKMDKAQSEFLLEDNPIFLCLSAWLAKQENVGREVTSNTLYNDFQIIAQTEGISFTYKNATSFGIRLRNIIDDLHEFFDVGAEKRKNKWTYIFQPKG